MATHQEYISGRKFNSSIKNLLRDYYTYGFKGADDYVSLTDSQMAKIFEVTEEQMAKVRNATSDNIEATIDLLGVDETTKAKLRQSVQKILKQRLKANKVSTKTFTDDWNRLNGILRDYAKWSEGRERNRRTFLTTDSQSMSVNPFQRVYRFGGEDRPNYLYYFFHSMSALSDAYMASDEVITLGKKANESFDGQQRTLVKEIIKMDIDEGNRRYLLSLCDNTKSLLAVADSLQMFGKDYQILRDIINGRYRITPDNSKLSMEDIWILGLSISERVPKAERRILRLIEAMDMDEVDHLLLFYNDQERLEEEAKLCLMSSDRTLRLQDAVSGSVKLKTSEFMRFYPSEELEKIFDQLHISKDKKSRLRVHFSDVTELLKEAKKCELSDDQYYALEYALVGTKDDLKTVIERMKLEQSIEEKLIQSLKGNNSENVLRMAKKLLKGTLPEDFEKKIYYASPTTIVTVIESSTLKDKVKKKLKKSLTENNIENLVEAARGEGLSDIQIIRLQKAVRVRDEKKEQAYKATTVNNRLQRYYELGIMQCDQNTGKAGDLNGHRKWSLSPLTLSEILFAGTKVNAHFENHLQAALDFYSRTFLFGEIGMYLMDRFCKNYDSPIRIKHEYFMHSLNDFNVIDLMYAIENKEWCLITYQRENIDTQLLVYPLELRIGSTTGREYLMYYEPVKRACTSLRLEFIESIQYYHDKNIRECLSDVYRDMDLHIDSNIEKARLLLEYVWGVSTGNVHEENVENLDDLFETVKFRVKYQKDKDYYILDRLYRESRIGRISVNNEENYIEFSVTTADAGELASVIRGFYSRIISCTGIDAKKFSLETDIADMRSQYISEESNKNEPDDNYNRSVWEIDKKLLNRLGQGLAAAEHEKIFNAIFSVQYYIFADVLKRITYDGVIYTDQEVIKICRDVLKDHEEAGSYIVADNKLILKYLTEGGFLVPVDGKEYGKKDDKKNYYIPKYHSSNPINMYKDVIPLTKIEVRWLKTILEDDKIFYFFSDEEVSSMKRIFAQYSIGIHPFPMHTVNYFDRYKFSEKQEWKASAVLNRILEAIRDQKILEVRYSGESKKTEPYEMTPERTWSFENEKLEDLLERLQITEDTQNRLRDYFSDTTELLIEAKGCGMSDDQYCALKYALIGTTDSLKTVIKQMNLEQSAEDKLIRSLNSNNIDNVLRMAKKIMEDKLPDDFEQKLRAATQTSIVKVIDEELKECQDRQKKKKLKRSLNKNNIENLLEAAREAGLSDIQIIRLQEAGRARDEKKRKNHQVLVKEANPKFYMPVFIEYSKRNNYFQGYFREYRNGKNKGGFESYNLAQIVSVEETEESFDWITLKDEFAAWHKAQMTEVHLEFPDVNNIADRVLTQFSPWEKECEFDGDKGIYHLRISYPKRDEKDMVVRLLGFGSEIRIIDDNHTLPKMIKHRLDDQMDLIKKSPVRTGERVDTVR